MDGLCGKELDDSIFGTDSHLDWAEEVNTLEALNDDRRDSTQNSVEEPGRQRRAPSPRPSHDTRRRGSRGDTGKDARTLGRRQQSDRPPRPARSSADSSNYARSTSRGEYSSSRGSSRGEYNASRGTSRSRSGRSLSRVGGGPGPSLPPLQQGYSQASGINIRGARAMRDRSRSMERPGSLDQGRGWRGPSSVGRSRADNADRWEHDRFEGNVAQSTRSLSNDTEYIGKEGVSHVTINRRESSASSRGYPSASYETSRRMFPDANAPPLPTPDAPPAVSSSHARKPSALQVVPSSGGARPVSPRSPGTNEPYRAPHRRQSSADTTHPPPLSSVASAAVPLLSPQGLAPKATLSSKPTLGEADDESSSAEMEWENFVANGGLDMPIDRITDDLLKHPHSRSQSVVVQAETPQPVHEQHYQPPVSHAHVGSFGLESAHDRTALLLNNNRDDDDDVEVGRNANRPDSLYERSEGEAEQKSISIRGSASVAAISHLESSMTSLAIGPAVTPRANRSGASVPERTPRKGPAPAQKQPLTQASDASALGIRIKGSSIKPAVNGRAPTPADARTPTIPPSPVAKRSVSRSSSGDEGRPAAQGSTPSSYLRRQFEVYDEDRGRHLFSVNIPYDDGRYAPIHIHEKDDLPKLAAKFARTWRVHNKELRIKTLLTKVKALMQDSL